MSCSSERKPLLSLDDQSDSEESFNAFTQPKSSYSNPYSVFNVLKRGKYFPRTAALAVVVFCTVSAIKQYESAMSEMEVAECSDVMADCDGISLNETIIPPYYNYLQDFAITRRYHLSLCLIPKVMSTIATATLCYLDDPEAFTRANRTISKESYKHRFCMRNEMKSYRIAEHELKGKVNNIIIVRDPFDRFISGYIDKCVKAVDRNLCHGCGVDMACFLQKEYRRLKRMSMLFPVYTIADTHFAPQTWFCDMKNTLNSSTLVKYSNSAEERSRMIDDFSRVFRSNKVPEQYIEEVRKEMSKGKSHHTTAGSELRMEYENLVRENSTIRRAIVRIYYYDFVVLRYNLSSLDGSFL